MSNSRVREFFYLLLSFALLIAPLPLSAFAETVGMQLSSLEREIISNNQNLCYVYIGDELSNIRELIIEIQDLIPTQDAAITSFAEYIQKEGLNVIEYNDLILFLEHIEVIIENNSLNLDTNTINIINNNSELIKSYLNKESPIITTDSIPVITELSHNIPSKEESLHRAKKIEEKTIFEKHMSDKFESTLDNLKNQIKELVRRIAVLENILA